MMKILLILICLGAFVPDFSRAEPKLDSDEIETDRDSFTAATSTVGHGRFVFESAYSFIDNRHVLDTHSLPELIVRYGLSKSIELRFGQNYEEGGAGNPFSGNTPEVGKAEHGEESAAKREYSSRVLYGGKASLTEQGAWSPNSALILHGYTPTSGENMGTTFSGAYVFGWKLPNDWVWDSALRYGRESFEGDDFNTWSSSTVLKVGLGDHWKAHAEYIGVFSEGRQNETTQHFISPGVHVLLSPDFEVGVRVGWGVNRQAPEFFGNLGFGYRLSIPYALRENHEGESLGASL